MKLFNMVPRLIDHFEEEVTIHQENLEIAQQHLGRLSLINSGQLQFDFKEQS